MTGQTSEEEQAFYDRQLLLLGAKRNSVLALWEVKRHGTDSFQDEDYVSVYGMRPDEWYAKGIRILGRTAVECTRDALGDAIGKNIAVVAGKAGISTRGVVIDPFAGSANTLVWILRHLPGARGLGFELDPIVFELTTKNRAVLGLPIGYQNTDYRIGLGSAAAATDELVIAFIAPPWVDALSRTTGLDLRRTAPPIMEIVELLARRFANNRLLCAVQVYEALEAESFAELRTLFDWSALHVYNLNQPGENHGLLLGTL
jgi:hypothetical protein